MLKAQHKRTLTTKPTKIIQPSTLKQRTKHVTKRKQFTTSKRSLSTTTVYHNLESPPTIQRNINCVQDWGQERKHRLETFNALQSKYINFPLSPHQRAVAQVLMNKYQFTSQSLGAGDGNSDGNSNNMKQITIKLDRGKTTTTTFTNMVTTPLSLLPQSLQEQYPMNVTNDNDEQKEIINHTIVVASINGQLWDLQRPIDLTSIPTKKRSQLKNQQGNDSTINNGDDDVYDIEFHDADSKIGQQVLWHSTAHILGQALELEYQHHIPLLSDGPALPDGGFFYDVYLHDKNGQPLTIEKNKMKSIATRMQKIVQQKQSFDRLVVTIDDAKQVFRYNPFKLDVLDRIQIQHDTELQSITQQLNTTILSEQQKQDEIDIKCAKDMIGYVTLYKCGSFIDLCRGPHVLNTSQCGSIDISKNSASILKNPLPYTYDSPSLSSSTSLTPIPTHISSVQRVYGISFPTQLQLDQHIQQKLRAEEIDHRRLGTNQHLFMFHQYSPGSPFWLPHGTRIYNKLVEYLRHEYKQRGYNEVRTPQVFDKTLWETSGHWDNYKEDMFFVSKGKLSLEEANLLQSTHTEGDKILLDEHPHPHHRLPSNPHPHHKVIVNEPHQHSHSHQHNDDPRSSKHLEHGSAQQALKPMNCPGHCILYKTSHSFSYRDLPIRFADFSNLHRNEASGALSGLTRVRCFAQDDAHIFARPDQLQDELTNALQFIQDVYKTFNFPVYYKLSTRPETYIGDLQTWDNAESILTNILNTMNVPWTLNEGDGAFYGPKVDITVKDALGRYHQCATIQLDYNLPERFGLEYKASDGTMHRPVMIHRAILGSLERFVAVLLEHTEGNLPLWLSPRQVLVTSVSPQCQSYADSVAKKLTDKGIYADVANLNERIAKQVKMAQSLKYNYIITVGEKEINNNTVTLRLRGHAKEEPAPMDVDAFVSRILNEIDEKKL